MPPLQLFWLLLVPPLCWTLRPHSDFSEVAIDQYLSAELLLTSVDQNERNSLIVKKIDDNLTLSCMLVDSNNISLPIENLELNWLFPLHDSNRSRIIWTEGNTLHLTMEFLQSGDAGQYTCIASNLHTFIAHTNVAVKPSSLLDAPPFCGTKMFSCGDESSDKMRVRCVPYSFLCDGRSDCPLPARDESLETCGTTDPCLDKLRCGDGRCIPRNWCCNGRKSCTPHPCCAEHMSDDFPFERTGGGLRKNPNDPVILHATLYKVCAFLTLLVISVSLFISAICKVRLKRITNGQVLDFHTGIASPVISERHITNNYSASSPAVQDCQYSLVRYGDTESNYEVVNPITCPPSYSEYMNQSTEAAPNSVVDVERDEPRTVNNSPARRPNDFGMGLIANAIFNTRYRPVPTQQNLEITSMDYVTDSDSSCRSPVPILDNQFNLVPGEFNSHFYGERIGGSPDINALRGIPDNRRLRHANALDRILDRFGLNAPYNVDINRDNNNRATWECQSFISPTESNNQSRTIWSRLKDRFRSQANDRSNSRYVSGSNQVLSGGNFNNGRQRRRPDTPDVPESAFAADRQPHALTCFLGEDRRLDFPDGGYQRGVVFSRDLRLVPAQSFPPPYSQFAQDPPPPYVSRENLIASRVDLNPSDQNGNSISTEVVNATVDGTNENVGSTHSTIVAFEQCDGNGNVELDQIDCSQCVDSKICNVHSAAPKEKDESNSEEPSTSSSSSNGNDKIISSVEDEVNGNETVTIERSSDKLALDQNDSSVRSNSEDSRLNCESSEVHRTTDERGLIFPPSNLEFIDSDINEDRSRLEV